MAKQTERAARLLVRALYYATDSEHRWWMLPTEPNDLTKEAIAVAVARGWMLDRGDSVCLTDAGRDLVTRSTEPGRLISEWYANVSASCATPAIGHTPAACSSPLPQGAEQRASPASCGSA
jgi:hypothetical protein